MEGKWKGSGSEDMFGDGDDGGEFDCEIKRERGKEWKGKEKGFEMVGR